ncbi:recombinase family protein [Streptomyces sp. NRRL S-87]|uniref:recombinase family protein n=1 Tax=Streptomyces sp. NRRL S-87 TaxID=1463920 RepID=UPI00131AC18B|nr:recombinase family protein [Streptomyces sp. NRRL S-87]
MAAIPRGRVPVREGGLRLVGAVRLSRYTDASTSPEVQKETVERAGARVGGTFVGWAEDTDVSALKTTPWERPKLAYWLERPDEWDVMIWQRMDRAVRSMADMADLGRYAKKNGKRLIFASGPGGDRLELDFSSPMSELIMLILAFAAQLEGQTIMERNQGAAAHLQSLGRWTGGTLPYGYKPGRRVFGDGNEGWWLYEHTDDDPRRSTADIRRRMVGMATAGRNYSEITRWLEEFGAITPTNHRALMATPPRDLDAESRWQITVVRELLLSPTMRGHILKKDGTLVRGEEGAPILQGEPLIDDATWYGLQDDALKARASGNVVRRKDAHPLLNVVVCGACDRNMYLNWYTERKGGRGEKAKLTGVKKQVFRCNGKYHAPGEPAMTIHAEPVMEWITGQFLAHLGPMRRTQLVRVPGSDHRGEIADLTADIDELSMRLAQLRGRAADVVMQQLQARSDRLEELEATPVVPPREEVVQLDVTWGDDWRAAEDWTARRHMLISAGVRVKVSAPPRWRAPVDERCEFLVGTHVDPVEDMLADIVE